ncbi:MAG: cytochrome P450 [Parahaliea sp.]
MNAPLSEKPAHVSKDAVFDFNFYGDELFGEKLHESLEKLHERAPDVFWTPRNGGHWVVTRFAQIAEVVLDTENFSAREQQIPRLKNPPTFIPLSLDPPDNVPYRQALMPVFAPKSIRIMEDKIRFWARHILDGVMNRGECDFIRDVSEPFPISIFMELMGMDVERLREFRDLAEYFFAVQNQPAEFERVSGEIVGLMTEYIEQKRSSPDEGLISHLVHTDVGGRKLRLDELQNMCFLLCLGGMHTVTNLTGFAYQHLATQPALQQRLVEDATLIPAFVEESVRMFGVIHTPRIVARDCEKFGMEFRAGEMVLCMLPLAGRDERVTEHPGVFNIDRPKHDHLTFSRGPHLCIGHFLARTEIRILTEEWLKRIPRFALKPGPSPVYTLSTGNGLKALPLVWDT